MRRAVLVTLLVSASVVLHGSHLYFQTGESRALLDLEWLVLLASVPAVFLVLIFCAVVPRWRRFIIAILVCWTGFLAMGIVALLLGPVVRRHAFAGLAERSRIVVDAIKKYEQQVGAPPSTLAELVPAYLSSYPSTGMAGYPEYRYVACPTPKRLGPQWALCVDCSSGILNYDQFTYSPLTGSEWAGNPTTRSEEKGKPRDRYGDWVYEHD
jgi:hypothetical protein